MIRTVAGSVLGALLLIGCNDAPDITGVQLGGPGAVEGAVTTAAVPEVAIAYGQFIQDAISFTLLALVVFIIVKKVLEGMKKEEAKPAEKPPEPSAEEKLLTEIRDVLKAKG